MIGRMRAVARALALLTGALAALAHFAILTAVRRRSLTLDERARWLHAWCRVGLRILGVQLDETGEIPRSGLLAANHLSYLDILVFSAMAPAVFVSKIEVKSWPLFGLMARLGGSLFVDRRRLRCLPGVIAQAEAVLRSGALLVLFPEATTTDGSVLLPFRPPLFEAAVRSGVEVTASRISYTLPDGSFDQAVCWWGDMELLPHLKVVLARQKISAQVRIATSSRIADRKVAAALTQVEVLQLATKSQVPLPAPRHSTLAQSEELAV